ncbi:MAG: hypothetical protein CMM25_06685, partial [Rhodospirillaceae bacterium]|nr:hypothetical protein [Rhodospirillaceae bacterium]
MLDKGVACHQAGDLNGALNIYNTILRKKPLNPDALWLKGAVFVQLEQPLKAIKVLQKAVKFRPSDPMIWNDLGMAYEANLDIALSRHAFEKAFSLDPKTLVIRINRARCLFLDGQADEALIQIDSAIALDGTLGAAHNVRGLILKKIEKVQDAAKAFSSAMLCEPQNLEFMLNKAQLLILLKQFNESEKIVLLARKLSKPGSKYWINATTMLGVSLS